MPDLAWLAFIVIVACWLALSKLGAILKELEAIRYILKRTADADRVDDRITEETNRRIAMTS